MEHTLYCEANHEFSYYLRSPKNYYCIHESPSLVVILSQINPVHVLLSYFYKLALILSFHLHFFLNLSLSFRCSN
jgi:hypothetical protein